MSFISTNTFIERVRGNIGRNDFIEVLWLLHSTPITDLATPGHSIISRKEMRNIFKKTGYSWLSFVNYYEVNDLLDKITCFKTNQWTEKAVEIKSLETGEHYYLVKFNFKGLWLKHLAAVEKENGK